MFSVLQRAFSDALALVLPVDCAGCGCADTALCPPCAAVLSRPVPRLHVLPSGLAVHAAFAFDGPAAGALRALKEEGRTSLARPLGAALAAAAARVDTHAPVYVPIPTSARAFRTRGYRVVDLLLARSGLARVSGLTPVRTVADQRQLGREERAVNVAGSLRAAPALAGRTVVVVDDVVTTGATVDEAARALRAVGAHVLSALCVAQTQRAGIVRDTGMNDD